MPVKQRPAAPTSRLLSKHFGLRPIAWPVPRMQIMIGDRIARAGEDHRYGELVPISVPAICGTGAGPRMTVSRQATGPLAYRRQRADDALRRAMLWAMRLRAAERARR